MALCMGLSGTVMAPALSAPKCAIANWGQFSR